MRKILFSLLVSLLVFGGAGGIALATSSDSPTAAFAVKDDDEDEDHSGHGSGGSDDESGNSGPGGDDGGNNDDEETSLDIDPSLDAIVNPGVTNADGHQVHVVRIIDEAFVPAQLTVRTGDFVVFVNLDNDEHTASGSGIDTGTINDGQTAVVSFDTPDTISYFCAFHSEMTGEIIVDGSDSAAEATPPAETETASQPEDTVDSTPAAESANSASTGEVIEIDIDNLTFTPLTATIAPGTTVRWTNNDDLPHTVSGEWGDSGNLDPGQTFEWIFEDAGTFTYTCAYHPNMTGEIVVDG